MAQTAQPFTKRDAKAARQYYQHVAAIINRLLNRVMQGLDEGGRKAFKPSVFHTVHALHAFFHGRDLSKKDLIVAHKFVTPCFDYTGHEDNAAKFMDRRLDALLAAERACGRRFVEIERADGERLLFTWYKSHPLLDAAERLYLEARQKPDYWKCASAAVTDEMLDRAIESLPVVEPEPVTEAAADEGDDNGDSDDLMTANVIKGMWTKVINNAERALEKEDDNGSDAELVAKRVAAKIIAMGKAIKARRSRELLRSAMAVRSADEIADGHSLRIRPEPLADILEEMQEQRGSNSVTTNGGGSGEPTLDINVHPPESEVVETQEFGETPFEEMTELQRNGVEYARAGLTVVPNWGVSDGICDCPAGSECRSKGKHPHSQLARNGVYSGSSDPPVVLGWFKKDPRINLGVAGGGALNLVFVDVDPRHEGDASYSDLIDAHGEGAFPHTFTVKTPSGGWHHYYKLPYTIKPERGELKGALGPGIDIKGVGGQVIMPGSSHLNGGTYAVQENTYIVEAPEWMVNVLLKAAKGEKPEVVVDFQAHRDRSRAGVSGATIVEGERNNKLFKVGCALWGKGEVSSRAELFQRLQEVNGERVSPPLDSDEVWKIAESIARLYPPGVPIQEGAA
jgi:putative DNA primase/helicase